MSTLERLLPLLAAVLLLASGGCYRGAGAAADPAAIACEDGWVRVDVPLVRQRGKSDCGVAALASVLSYHGKSSSLAVIERWLGGAPAKGVRASQLGDYARTRGLAAFVFYATVPHDL